MEASWSYDATELRLGLPGNQAVDEPSHKRALMEDNNNNNESKVQVVVGWPPVRSHRINVAQNRKPAKDEEDDISSTAMYMKVSMDGAPYLRKIDLKVYKDYKDLRYNLEDMFTSFLLGEHVITYEDKDGDWMMVGDVPWEMFISICKRLRIMKGSEARGLGSSL